MQQGQDATRYQVGREGGLWVPNEGGKFGMNINIGFQIGPSRFGWVCQGRGMVAQCSIRVIQQCLEICRVNIMSRSVVDCVPVIRYFWGKSISFKS